MLSRYNVEVPKHMSALSPWLANLRSALGISTIYSAYSGVKAVFRKIDYYTSEHGKKAETARASVMQNHFKFASHDRTVRRVDVDGLRYPTNPIEFWTFHSARNILETQQKTEKISDIPQVAGYLTQVLEQTRVPRPRYDKDVPRIQELLEYVGEARDYLIAVDIHNTTLALAEVYHENYTVGGMNPKTPGNVAGTITGVAAGLALASVNPVLAIAAPFIAHRAKEIAFDKRSVTIMKPDGSGFERQQYIKEDPSVRDYFFSCINELLPLLAPDWLTQEQRAQKGLFGAGPRIKKIESQERREAFENALIASLPTTKLYPWLQLMEFYAMRNQQISY